MQKRLILLALIATIPSFANAASNATASINNFGYEVVFGVAPDFDNSSFYVSTTSTSASGLIDSDYASAIPFQVSSLITDANSSASGTANENQAYSNASATAGQSQNSTFGGITINYTHGTLLHFFGNASVFGSNDSLNEYSYASAFLNATTYSTLGTQTQFNSELSASAVDGGSFSKTDTLNLYFYSAQDQTIYFQAGVATIANAVPEPENLAMMLVGIGLLGAVTSRNRKES